MFAYRRLRRLRRSPTRKMRSDRENKRHKNDDDDDDDGQKKKRMFERWTSNRHSKTKEWYQTEMWMSEHHCRVCRSPRRRFTRAALKKKRRIIISYSVIILTQALGSDLIIHFRGSDISPWRECLSEIPEMVFRFVQKPSRAHTDRSDRLSFQCLCKGVIWEWNGICLW